MKTNILDLPDTTIQNGVTIQSRKFLRNLYLDFYQQQKDFLKDVPKGKILELGSGGGFIEMVIPNTITSDVIKLPDCQMQINAEKIPFKNNSVSAILMLNTFHHIKNPDQALNEFYRILKKGGKVVMIEPYNSLWGRFIYKNFHYEGFDENASWKTKGTGPLSDANNALPWIVFERDLKKYQNKYPNLKLVSINPHTPLRYLLSGGLTGKFYLPASMFGLITMLENLFNFLNPYTAMFVTIVLVKKN